MLSPLPALLSTPSALQRLELAFQPWRNQRGAGLNGIIIR